MEIVRRCHAIIQDLLWINIARTNIASLVSDHVWELADRLLERGESLTRFGGVNTMNHACDVSLFSIENLKPIEPTFSLFFRFASGLKPSRMHI
jgi:hypothetical protein